MQALSEVVRAGKMRYLGFGMARPDQIDENAAASGHHVPAELFHRAETNIARAGADGHR
jgi:aryl-alcohol dehydrogenase-like predicted oxidoreductase